MYFTGRSFVFGGKHLAVIILKIICSIVFLLAPPKNPLFRVIPTVAFYLFLFSGILSDILSGIFFGIRVQACHTASGAGEMVFGPRRGPQHELADEETRRKRRRKSGVFIKI